MYSSYWMIYFWIIYKIPWRTELEYSKMLLQLWKRSSDAWKIPASKDWLQVWHKSWDINIKLFQVVIFWESERNSYLILQ